MKKIENFLSDNQFFLKMFLATIAAASTFDFVAFPTPIGNLKLAFILAFPLLLFTNVNELSLFLKNFKYLISLTVVIFLISFLNSHDKLGSLKWTIQLALDFSILLSLYNGLKLLKNYDSFLNITLSLILIPALFQWLMIQLGFEPIFITQTHGVYYRINGLSFYPNFFTVAVSLFLPLMLFKNENSKVSIILIFVSSFLLIQSTSRTGLLALGILLFLGFFINKNKWSKIFPIILAAVISISLPEKTLTNTNASGLNKLAFFTKELNLAPAVSPLERVYIAKQGLKVIKDFPLFGVGPLAYEKFIHSLNLKDQDKYFAKTMRGYLYESHENIWIELMANNGIIFSLLIILLLFNIFKANFNHFLNFNIGIFISLVLYYSVNGQFVQNILYPPTFVIWAIFCYSINHENKHNHSHIQL